MRKRTTLFASALVAGATLAAAVPAQAQSYQHNRYEQNYRYNGNGIRQQIEQLQYRISRSDNRDRISEREAAGLRRQVADLRMQYRDYSRNGLTQREARILQDRIDQVRSRLQYERRDNDGRRW